MKKQMPLRVVLAGFFVCFCIFIFAYERHSLKLQQHAIERHARIIAPSVRDMEPLYYKEYLDSAALHSGYINLAVTGAEGKIFYAASTDISGFADTVLENLGLIRQVQLQAPIIFNGQTIGRITVVWLNKAVYGYANVLLLGALLIIILLLYNRILRSKEILEEKVAARTADLEKTNRDLLESRERYSELIDKANSIIVRRKIDGTITFMNQFGLDFFGYAEAEIIGRNVVGTIVPETESSGRNLVDMIGDISRNPEKYVNNENENVCKDGRRVWVSWTNRVSGDISGLNCEVLSIGVDDTVRKATEESLRQSLERLQGREQELEALNSQLQASNQQLRASRSDLENAIHLMDNIFQTSIEGLITTDEKGYINRANRAALKILGCSAEAEVVGRHMAELGPQEEPYSSIAVRVMTEMREKGFIHDLETSLVRQDGSRCPVEFNGAYLMNDAGERTGSVLSVRDITERKLAEVTLRESEERFRAIAETTPDAIFTTDENMNIVFWNAAAERIFGYTRQEMVGRPAEVLIPKSQFSMHQKNKELLRDAGLSNAYGTPVESTALRKDGTEFPIEVSLTSWSLHGTNYVSTILRDISGRKQAESVLRESEERFRALAETSPDAIFTTDEDMTIVFWNAAAERTFGYTQEEIMGCRADPLIPAAKMERHQIDRKLILETGQSPAYRRPFESTARRKDGTEFPVEVSLTSWHILDKPYFSMILRDITERKQAENDIRASNEFLKTILKASPDIIIATDAQGNITMLSDTAEAVFGYAPDEVLGQPTAVLVAGDEENRKYALDMMGEFFSTGSIRNCEIPWKKKDGSVVHIEWNGLLLKDEDGNIAGSVGIVRDISSRKQMEGQIRQAQKMESIGTLAGGIAHDFNNILTAIIGYTEMNLYHAEGNASVRHNSENVLKAAGRARDLVTQILTFSRPGDEERKPVQARPIVQEACKLLRASLPASIDLQLFLVSESYVFAAPTHLHQIIINLCTNASHALQERGGLLSVSLEDADIEAAADASLPELLPGRYLKLTVTDTGSGIDPTIIHRIFDPFFTTKESGKGTGMGLAMVYGIVKSYGGAITVASEISRGSSFTVYLPRIQGAETGESLQEPEAPKVAERILFVDDEELIVEAGLAMLQTLGYDVVTANEPARALEIFREHDGNFDLVITDYTMPNMNGFDLAGEIMRLRPGIPVMLCTGFSENMTPEKAQAAGIKAFVMKPFSRLEFAQAIRKALEAGSA